MGYTLTAVVGASTFDFAANGFFVLGEVGLGEAPVQRLETSGAQQHGATDRGFYLRPRNFGIDLGFEGTSFDDYWKTKRQQLIRLFKPSNTPIHFRFDFGGGDVRQIDCHYRGGLDFPSGKRVGHVDQVLAEFRAGDPTLYDPVEAAVTFALGGGSASFDIPLDIPWNIGSSVLDQTRIISYTGSWMTHPIVRIEGPITDAKIENETTGEKLDFDGVTIAAGDWYEVDTRYGHKSVVDSNGNNKQADLSDDSHLGSFHLEAPEGAAASRNNDVRVTGTSVTEATEVYFRYKVRYTGI
jgi:hypothetical protein